MGDSGGGRGGGGGKDAGSKAALANQAQAHYSVGKYEKALECLQRLATQMVRLSAGILIWLWIGLNGLAVTAWDRLTMLGNGYTLEQSLIASFIPTPSQRNQHRARRTTPACSATWC